MGDGRGDDTIKKLDAGGAVVVSVPTGLRPSYPAFDGTNIWVPNLNGYSVTVIRATGSLAGTVLETLTDNGLEGPNQAAFDGERILVTNYGGHSVSLWKAADLTPIGTFPAAHFNPFGVCSDGLNFWVTITFSGQLARF